MAKRNVLVTGGMGGLGESICTKMADQGYTVVTTYSPGNKTAKEWLAGMKSARLRLSGLSGGRRGLRFLRRLRANDRCRKSVRSTYWSTTPALPAT